MNANSLDDEKLAQYLRDGYVVLSPGELDADYHVAMHRAACEIHDEASAIGGDSGHLQVIGDNLRARVPHLEQLLGCATVQGAVTSALGEDFILHPHHFVHEASTGDQSFHQDGNLPWNDRAHYRSHRSNWAMLFYYPQAVTLDAGPTEVLPGTQYWTTDFEKPDGSWHKGDAVDKSLRIEELRVDDLTARDQRLQTVVDTLGVRDVARRRLEVPAGSIVLAHYDLMHRGTRRSASYDGRRFMYKFYYLRTRMPAAHSGPRSRAMPKAASPSPAEIVAESAWHWLHGNVDWQPDVTLDDQLDRIVCATAEDERVPLAYEIGWLARANTGVREQLRDLLFSEVEAVRRSAAYAVGIAGPACAPMLIEAMASADPRIRRIGAYASGEADASTPEVIEALFGLLDSDEDDLVRSNAAYALGWLGRRPDADVSAARLLAKLSPAVEPDNTANGGMSRSTVRVDVMYALCNLATLADAELASLAEHGLRDGDRYVRGLAVALLEREARQRGAPWLRAFVTHLVRTRFNERPPRPEALDA